MGTRSLLGYELPNGNIYAQYMQFDGYPSVKGHEYYTKVLKGFASIKHTTKKGSPKPQVFKRIRHFLDEYQYASGHSVNSNFTCNKKDWYNSIDCNQEWQYLWHRNGDYEITPAHNPIKIIIPWNITLALPHEHRILEGLDNHTLFWETLGHLKELNENKMVLGWKELPLYIPQSKDLYYDSSKTLYEQRLKNPPPTPA